MDIPYSNGPWKLNGLPGLIVEALDDKREVQFLFTGFSSNEQEKFNAPMPDDVVKTTPKDFPKYEEAIKKNREASKGNTNSLGGVFLSPHSLPVSA